MNHESKSQNNHTEMLSNGVEDLKNILCQQMFLATVLVTNLGEKIQEVKRVNGRNISKRSDKSD